MATGPVLVETVEDLTELATLSMQAMVIFDDFDDKVAGKDDLLRRMALTKEQIEATLQGLREIVNAAHTARNQACQEVALQVTRGVPELSENWQSFVGFVTALAQLVD